MSTTIHTISAQGTITFPISSIGGNKEKGKMIQLQSILHQENEGKRRQKAKGKVIKEIRK